MRFYQFLSFSLLLSVAVIARAQTAPPGVNVKLSLADNKTVYKIGEPIKLVMEFTADREGYLVEFAPDNKEPGLDTIVIAPETGVTRWLDELSYRRVGGRHAFATDKLTKSPREIEIFLNDWVRFDAPGRYTVSVNTRRIWLARPPSNDTKILSVSTNWVSFEVQPMTEPEEEKEVKRIVDLLAARREPRSDNELGRQLSYLTGDPSTREKAKRYLSFDDRGNGGFSLHMWYGLFIARNRSLALKLVEAGMRDPNRPVTSQILHAATSLKNLLVPGTREKLETSNTILMEVADPRVTEISDAYVMELAAGLGKRSGESQTTTAITILTALPKDSQGASAGLREVRRILVQQFDSLHPFSQEHLLQQYWEQLRDPALVPSLKRMMTSTGAAKNLRGTALRRLLEMTPDEVRPYVIAEIRHPSSLVDPELLAKLKDESLPEIDAPLLEQIRVLAESNQPAADVFLRVKAALLVRFATANIYRSVLELYQSTRTKLSRDSRAGMLAYLAKHNEREGIALIEQVISEFKPGDDPGILSELTKLYYSESIGALLKKLLETDDAAQASHAAYLIGRQGVAGDEQVLEARLKRWREQWGNRIGESDAETQGQVERELIYALIHSKGWKLPPERVKELKQSCLTKMCKETHQLQ
jgi:hypothetical protein